MITAKLVIKNVQPWHMRETEIAINIEELRVIAQALQDYEPKSSTETLVKKRLMNTMYSEAKGGEIE